MRGSLFNKVASRTTWSYLTVLKRGSSTGVQVTLAEAQYFSVNFAKFLGKLFCRKLPNNHVSHDVFFFSFLQISEVRSLKSVHFLDKWQIRRRNSLASSMLCSYENQVETSLPSCSHTCTQLDIGSGRKRRTERFGRVGWILFICNGRLQNFHMSEK